MTRVNKPIIARKKFGRTSYISDNSLIIPEECLPENKPEILQVIIKTNIFVVAMWEFSVLSSYLNVAWDIFLNLNKSITNTTNF